MFAIPEVPYIYMYTKPISMQWGDNKMTQICRNEMGIDPRAGDVFLFYNRKKDQLRIFFCNDRGTESFTKMLPKGGFMIPTANKDEPYVKIVSKKLPALFRTDLW